MIVVMKFDLVVIAFKGGSLKGKHAFHETLALLSCSLCWLRNKERKSTELHFPPVKLAC